jgi:hypothetical protein
MSDVTRHKRWALALAVVRTAARVGLLIGREA